MQQAKAMTPTHMTQYPTRRPQYQEISIRIPEGVVFSLPLAGPVGRFLAWLLDACCILAAAKIIKVLVGLLGVISMDLSQAFSIFFYFVFTICYAMILEWFWNGQTVGKRIFDLRVIDMRGLPLQPSQVVIRNLLRAVDSLPLCYLLGGVVSLASRYGQRLGDLAANTIVIKSAKVKPPRLDQLFEENRYNSLRDYPHLVARLRQQVSPQEADIALQALERRDLLLPAARVDLFGTMAAHFKAKVTFPDDALGGISDEQYVRDVVDILFRR
jgi:uncharacterized RDD family membrane protein YckC